MNIITFSSCETNSRERDFGWAKCLAIRMCMFHHDLMCRKFVIKTNYAFSARTLRKICFFLLHKLKACKFLVFFYSLIKSSTFNALRFIFKLMMCVSHISFALRLWEPQLYILYMSSSQKKEIYIVALNKLLKVKIGSIAAFF